MNAITQTAEMSDNKTSGFGYLVHDVARLLRRRFDEHARQHDLTLPQWRAIAQLSKADGLSQVTLASLTETDPMTLSGIIDRLESKLLVERVPDPSDSRAKLVRITPKSRALVAEMRIIAGGVYEDALRGIGETDRQTLLKALALVCANLSTHNALLKEDQ
ncbi:MAG: MarR family transcriptional regulator [Hyphomicrobiales bacterium]|nr:MarR family transcriptional regulator [Hyphomicrobiales bacterium]